MWSSYIELQIMILFLFSSFWGTGVGWEGRLEKSCFVVWSGINIDVLHGNHNRR